MILSYLLFIIIRTKGGNAKTSLAYFCFRHFSAHTAYEISCLYNNVQVLMLYKLRNRQNKKYTNTFLFFQSLSSLKCGVLD
jgi:hypothetical protein